MEELLQNKCLKKYIFNIFKIIRHFNTILLMDETDIFLHEYLIDEVYNHSMTVFFHKLEYFKRILFLMINYINEFDNAILSKIHYKLKYKDLS